MEDAFCTLVFFTKRYFRSTSGTIRWMDGRVNVFASGVDVDVDVPWWVTLLRVGLFILGPIGWVLDATLVQPKLKAADEALYGTAMELAATLVDGEDFKVDREDRAARLTDEGRTRLGERATALGLQSEARALFVTEQFERR